jgi:hypothetical protein
MVQKLREGLGEVQALFGRILEQIFGAWFGGIAE